MSYGRSQSSREQKKMQTVTLANQVSSSQEDRRICSQRHDGHYHNRSVKRAADTGIPEATACTVRETRGLLRGNHQACNAGSEPEGHRHPQDIGTARM